MKAGAGRFGRPLAGLVLAILCCRPVFAQIGWEPEVGEDRAATSTAMTLEYASENPHSLTLRRVSPFWETAPSRLLVSYYHPLALQLTYQAHHSGPDGILYLPGNRKLSSELEFGILLKNELRLFSPDAAGTSVTVSIHPGWIQEQWTWADGLAVDRVYFQPARAEAAGMHFWVRNRSRHALNGLRLVARLVEPEITARNGKRNPAPSEPDELMADPRTETLYLRDTLTQEESWMAFGWGPQGGLMSGGGGGEASDFEELAVRLETQAWDISAGQNQDAFFWMLWGCDQETVMLSLQQLRRQPEYLAWEQRLQADANQGMQCSCRDPYLTYWFNALKAWSAWMQHKDALGNVYLASVADLEPATAAEISAGAIGWMALGQANALRNCLDSGLDQHPDTPELAAWITLAYRYVVWTRDFHWLNENQQRLEELLNHLAELDVNGDGLPEYYELDFAGREEYNPFIQRGNKPGGRMLQSASASIEAIAAFRQGAELLHWSKNKNRLNEAKYQAMAALGEETLEKRFWDPQLGRGGYYVYACMPETGRTAPHRGVGVMAAVDNRVGSPQHRAAVFQELWQTPSWRTPEQAYRTLPGEDTDFNGEHAPGQGGVSLHWTHAVLLAGLLQPRTADEALKRLLFYSRQAALNPQRMGGLSSKPWQGQAADFSSLNLVELLLRGLAGLEPAPEGLRIHIPAYARNLNLKIQNVYYAGTWLNIRVTGQGDQGRILINGREWEAGKLVPFSLLAKKENDILIERH